jgi:cobalamin biosynthesis Co2+ chelatase CbiK
MRSHSEANSFYQSLAEVSCEINDQAVNIHKGYYNAAQFELNIEDILESGHNYSKKVNRIEAGIYEKNFIHIDDEILIQNQLQKQVPADWQQLLPDVIINKLNEENLVYIKISLNRMFLQSTIEGLFCAVNSFPIINRKLNSINHRTDPLINIVPLPMDGGFLDLESVSSHDSKKYKYQIAANTNEVNAGEAVVRSTGIGKYNSQEVREIIDNLMDAIRNESAFFGEISNDFITARLQEISRIVARLEDQVIQAKDNKNPKYYLLLKPKNPSESVSINYWTTNGQMAKQVKAFALLSPMNHSIVNAQHSYTLNNSMGGKANLSTLEKKIVLKRQLLSGGRIVSKEDIKLLCFQLFGNKLKQVDINKSVLNGIGAKDGFSKSIEIKITPTKQAEESMPHELQYLARELEQNLQEHASIIYPFRVILNIKSTL